MLDESRILDLVYSVTKAMRDHEALTKRKDKKAPRYPEFYKGYNRMVKDYESIRVHSVKGVFPEDLIGKRSPNMTPEEHEYVKDNYKQLTLPIFIDYINSIKRAFNDNNWSILYAPENVIDDKPEDHTKANFRQYVEKFVPVFGSVENWMKNVLPTIKTTDANGIVVVRPYEIPYKLVEDEETGEFTVAIDDSVPVEPTMYYYNCRQVVQFKEDEWYLILTNRKSYVVEGSKEEKTGLVFELYDNENIWEIRQVGKKTDWKFEATLYYNHALGYVPVTRLLGVPVVEEDNVVFQSPFLYAVDNLDLVMLNSSNLQLAINNCVYPVRVMIGNECDFVDDMNNACIDGVIHDLTTNRKRTCPKCNGSGLKSRLSPNGTLLIRPKGMGTEGDANITDPLKFVSPEVHTLDFLEANIAKHEARAKSILHLTDTNTMGDPSIIDPSATGRMIDEQNLFSFIRPISNEMFYIFEFVLKTIGKMRNESVEAPEVQYPQRFDLLTEDDYLQSISGAIERGLPPFVIYTAIYRYLNSVFYTEGKGSSVFNLIMEADRLLTMTDEDIQLRLSNGTVSKWEDVLHSSAVQLIKELERTDERFWEKELNEQVAALQELAKAKAEEIKAEQPAVPDFTDRFNFGVE